MDDVVRCIISYHETRQFVQVLSCLIIQQESQWGFLKVIQKSKVPLDRSNLVKRVILDSSILVFILDTVQKSFNLGISHVSLTTFFNSTFMDFIQTKSMTENDLALMVPRLLSFLSLKEKNLQASIVMIINQLSSKCILDEKLIFLILEKMAGNMDQGNIGFMLSGMIVMIQLQDQRQSLKFPVKVLESIRDVNGAFKELMAINEKFNAEKFLCLLLSSCLSASFEQSGVDSSVEQGQNLDFLKKLCGIRLSPTVAEFLCDQLLQTINKNSGNDASLKIFKELYQVIPNDLNNVLTKYYDNLSDTAKKSDAVFALTQKALEGTLAEPLSNSGTSLLLSLEHPHSHLRCMAVKKLAKSLHKNDGIVFDAAEIEMLLLNRLKDDDEDVIRAVLKIKDLDTAISYKKLMDVLDRIIWSSSNTKTVISAITALLQYYKLEHDCQVDLSVFHVCFCFAFLSKGNKDISQDLIKNLKLYQPKLFSFLQDAELYECEKIAFGERNYSILTNLASKHNF